MVSEADCPAIFRIGATNDMRALANRIVHARKFDYLLVALISANAIMQGVRLSFDPEPDWLPYLTAPFWILMMLVLFLEVLLKMFALSPRADRYFRDRWNAFDFFVFGSLIACIILFAETITSYELLILLVRWLRLLRALPIVREMHLILGTLLRSIPSMGHIALLLGIVVYSYAVVGLKSFREHDPAHWGSLGVSVLTLFEIVTLEGWVDVMRPLVKVEPLAWLYFVSFVIISAYLVTNVFIAVVIRNLEQSMQERQQTAAAPASREEILRELRSTQQSLRRLEERLQQLPD